MDAKRSDEAADGSQREAPPKLVAAFKPFGISRVFVPPSLDEAILKTARNHLTPIQPNRWLGIPRWLLWPGIATTCAVLLLLIQSNSRQLWTVLTNPAFAREDVNQDSQVDILDAYQLARQLNSGIQPSSDLDLNGDGVVNRRDVEALAARAVRLEKGGRS